MADRYRASSRNVRLSFEDHEWLAKVAQDENVTIRAVVKHAVKHFRYWQEQGQEALAEALANFEAERSVHQEERRLRRHYQRKYELKSRRFHDALRDMRDLRADYESRLSDERDYYKRQARAAKADRNILHSPRVAKLLTLAIRSDSDGEAMTAFAKARALHREQRHSRSDTP